MRRVMAASSLSLLALLALVSVAQAATMTARIVGGSSAAANQVPWQALVLPTGFLCGGSVLDATHIITAAHCVYDGADITPPSAITVRAGTLHAEQAYASEGQTRSVTAVAVDPDYDPKTFNNDAAVLTLSQPLDVSGPAVQAIPLVDADFQTPSIGTGDFMVSGWGTTSVVEPGKPNSSKASPVLKRAIVHSAGECTNYIGYNPAVQVCAGEANNDACQGDSGGPLAIQVGPIWKLAGIVSAGAGCAWAGYPGLYTRVGNPAIRSFLTDRSNDPTANPKPVNQAAPTITGTAKAGARIYCSSGTWTGARWLSYRFVADGQTLADSVSEVALGQSAAGSSVRCEVTAKSLGGETVAVSDPVMIAPPDLTTGSPDAISAPLTTPTSSEHVPPVVKLKSARCARTSCVVYLTVTDPAPSSGIVRAEGKVVTSYRTWCRSSRTRKRTRCTKTQTRTLVSVVAAPGLYRLTTPRLKSGRRTFTLTAVDSAGNRPAKATTVTR
jgi:secreted trypsin-like serine protease